MFHCYFLITRYSLCSARQGSKTQTTAAVLLRPHRSRAAPPRGIIYLPGAGRARYTQENGNSSASAPAPPSDLNFSRAIWTVGSFEGSKPENCKTALMSSLLNPGSASSSAQRGGCANDASLDQPCSPENHCLAAPWPCSQQSSAGTSISRPTALRAPRYTPGSVSGLGHCSTSVPLPPGAPSGFTKPLPRCRAPQNDIERQH